MLNPLKLFTDKGKFYLEVLNLIRWDFLAIFGLLWIHTSAKDKKIALIFQILLFIERQESQRNMCIHSILQFKLCWIVAY